ncbi:alpha/beta fold hydrolase [Cryptosporangium sp. NPDC051539]|uniref:alpha/beta hydrolase n=1 Tax=Cryptosporangium sp. NPDC051539 TaxID=3363962 RepID=UPI003794AFE2
MRTIVHALVDERFDEVEASFAPRLRAVVSARTLAAAWRAETARIGTVVAVGTAEPSAVPGEPALTRYQVPVTGEHGGLTVVMSVDATGALHGLRLAPAVAAEWVAPPYASPDRFVERPVLDGAATVSVPVAPGPWPGAVLLAGGGPFDRDGTSGVNKPLKDLAWGLASRGVAVARFDKPTVGPGWTMTDEYVPLALAAAGALRDDVRCDRVFVVGHSMGGRVAPRVAAALTSIAGLVLLAADAEPVHHAAVRVARHLGWDAAALARQASFLDSPALTARTPAADLPFGWPASYWLDLREDDPVARAAGLGQPMLVLQGGRDYQVTVDDDLARWKAGLSRENVTFRVYEKDDHLFFPGTEPSTPAGYVPPQHVDSTVVSDIADWLDRLR